jgi:putative ABC transport system permease protein
LVRSVLLELDRSLPLWDVATMDERVSRITARDRFATVLLGVFGVLALLLAAVGIYGVLAFLVAQRTREVGLRMAIGATQQRVLALVLRHGLSFVLPGLGIGVALAVALARALEGQLYGVSPFDPATFTAAAFVLVSVAALACLLPARRAARIDPMAALRHE